MITRKSLKWGLYWMIVQFYTLSMLLLFIFLSTELSRLSQCYCNYLPRSILCYIILRCSWHGGAEQQVVHDRHSKGWRPQYARIRHHRSSSNFLYQRSHYFALHSTHCLSNVVTSIEIQFMMVPRNETWLNNRLTLRDRLPWMFAERTFTKLSLNALCCIYAVIISCKYRDLSDTAFFLIKIMQVITAVPPPEVGLDNDIHAMARIKPLWCGNTSMPPAHKDQIYHCRGLIPTIVERDNGCCGLSTQVGSQAYASYYQTYSLLFCREIWKRHSWVRLCRKC